MTAPKTGDRIVVSVTATGGGDWQVVSVPTGFEGIVSTLFSENDYLHGFVRHEDGEQWEVYDFDGGDNTKLLQVTSISGTVTLARPATPYNSSKSDNTRMDAGSGTHTLTLALGSGSLKRFMRETSPFWKTFTSADATPSVADYRFFKTNGTTAITRFDDLTNGQGFWVRRGNADIVIQHDGTNIDLFGAADLTLNAASPSVYFAVEAGVAKQMSGYVAPLDEDNFASNSDTLPPSQQSTKAYVDATGNQKVHYYDNFAAVRAIAGTPGSTAIYVRGYAGPNDGGGGIFLWNPSSSAADDDGIVLKQTSNSGTGRFIRDFTGRVNVKWYGAGVTLFDRATSNVDHAPMINAAIAAAIARKTDVYLPSHIYGIDGLNQIVIDGQCALIGDRPSYNQASSYYDFHGTWLWLWDNSAETSHSFAALTMNVTNNGAGFARLTFSTPHDFTTDTTINIGGTTNYNGHYRITTVHSATQVDIGASYVSNQSGTARRWNSQSELAVVKFVETTPFGGEYRNMQSVRDIGFNCAAGYNASHPKQNVRYAGVLSRGTWGVYVEDCIFFDAYCGVWIDTGTAPTNSDWHITGNKMNGAGSLGKFACALATTASNGSGGTRFTTGRAHGFIVGDSVVIEHCTATGYNTTHTVTAVTDTTHFDIAASYSASTKGWALKLSHHNNFRDTIGIGGYGANDGLIRENDVSGFETGDAIVGLAVRHIGNSFWLNDVNRLMIPMGGEGGDMPSYGNEYYDTFGPSARVYAPAATGVVVHLGGDHYRSHGRSDVWYDPSELCGVVLEGSSYTVDASGAKFGKLPGAYTQTMNYGIYAKNPTTITFAGDGFGNRGIDLGCAIGLTNVPQKYTVLSTGGKAFGICAVRLSPSYADLFIPVPIHTMTGTISVQSTGQFIVKGTTGNKSCVVDAVENWGPDGVHLRLYDSTNAMAPGEAAIVVDDGNAAGVTVTATL